jgi:hypothetical protein
VFLNGPWGQTHQLVESNWTVRKQWHIPRSPGYFYHMCPAGEREREKCKGDSADKSFAIGCKEGVLWMSMTRKM